MRMRFAKRHIEEPVLKQDRRYVINTRKRQPVQVHEGQILRNR